MCTRVALPWRALVTASPRMRASASLTSGPTCSVVPMVTNVTATPVRAAIAAAWRASTRSSGSSGARARCSIAQRESCSARSAATTMSSASGWPAMPLGAAADEGELLRDAVVQVARDPAALAGGGPRRDGAGDLEHGGPQQHHAEQQPQHVAQMHPLLGDRRQQRVVEHREREEQAGEPEPAGERLLGADAAARQADGGGGQAERHRHLERHGRERLAQQRAGEVGLRRPLMAAPLVEHELDRHDRGGEGRQDDGEHRGGRAAGRASGRAGAKAPAHTSSDPASMPGQRRPARAGRLPARSRASRPAPRWWPPSRRARRRRSAGPGAGRRASRGPRSRSPPGRSAQCPSRAPRAATAPDTRNAAARPAGRRPSRPGRRRRRARRPATGARSRGAEEPARRSRTRGRDVLPRSTRSFRSLGPGNGRLNHPSTHLGRGFWPSEDAWAFGPRTDVRCSTGRMA